jgi:hypothetical protein
VKPLGAILFGELLMLDALHQHSVFAKLLMQRGAKLLLSAACVSCCAATAAAAAADQCSAAADSALYSQSACPATRYTVQDIMPHMLLLRLD